MPKIISAPPEYVINYALMMAMMSPCAKSKRGVAIWDPAGAFITGAFNGPPRAAQIGTVALGPFSCTGGCRTHCSKVAVHAEARAIHHAAAAISGIRLHERELVHVKLDTDMRSVAPGGPPSCWQCSRLIAEVGVHVWLYEGTPRNERACNHHCSYIHVWGPRQDAKEDRDDCPNCGQEMSPIVKTFYDHPAQWRRYEPDEFHRITLANNGITIP